MMMARLLKTIIATMAIAACIVPAAMAEPTADALSPYYNANLSVPTDRNSAYDPTKALVNPVQEQGVYGTCWAFATVASIESNIYTQLQQQGIAYNVETDPVKFSPWYLAWTSSTPPTSVDLSEVKHLPGTPEQNDYFRPFAEKVYKGAMPDADVEFSLALGQDLQTMAPDDRSAIIAPKDYAEGAGIHLENIFIVRDLQKPESIQKVKELLARYGAAAILLNGTIMTQHEASDFYLSDKWEPDHAVTLIGWDDAYDFAQSGLRVPPQNKGAWIVRNSWGTDWAEKGDGYVSYEDAALVETYSYDVDWHGDSFDYIATHEDFSRLHDIDISYVFDAEMPANSAFAASYKEEEAALLTGVGFYVHKEGMSYSINVYKDCEDFLHSRPEPAYHQEGVLGKDGTPDCQGYRMVELTSPVAVAAGETHAVEVSLHSPDGAVTFSIAIDPREISADEVVSYINEGNGKWQKVLNHKGKYKNELFQAASVVQRVYLKRV